MGTLSAQAPPGAAPPTEAEPQPMTLEEQQAAALASCPFPIGWVTESDEERAQRERDRETRARHREFIERRNRERMAAADDARAKLVREVARSRTKSNKEKARRQARPRRLRRISSHTARRTSSTDPGDGEVPSDGPPKSTNTEPADAGFSALRKLRTGDWSSVADGSHGPDDGAPADHRRGTHVEIPEVGGWSA